MFWRIWRRRRARKRGGYVRPTPALYRGKRWSPSRRRWLA